MSTIRDLLISCLLIWVMLFPYNFGRNVLAVVWTGAENGQYLHHMEVLRSLREKRDSE